MKIGCRFSQRTVWQLTVVMALLCRSDVVVGGDWPQILGPQRDGRASDERLAAKFPEGGPQQVWEFRVGEGFAGVAIQGDRGILFHRVKTQEEVLCFNPQTGVKIWATQFPPVIRERSHQTTGPAAFR